MKRTWLFCLCCLMFVGGLAKKQIRVACVGNSVTYGYLLADREQTAYPAQLQQLLGADYAVGNFGHSGATLLRKGHRPYHLLPEFRQALDFRADMVVIHLGLNDTDPRNWPNYSDEFIGDYRALIDSFRVANPKVKIWICKMTPIFHTHRRFQSGTRDWHAQIQQRIEQIAATAGVGLIDLYEPLHSRPDLFPDALHPNAEGAGILASTVCSAITGRYGGLSLPPTYSDGMVIQRNRPIRLHGTADAGERVKVEFLSQRAEATADAAGRWSVSLPAAQAGGPYEMVVKTSRREIRLKDVWLGEVWVCSGQSNMEWELRKTLEAQQGLAAADTLSRLHFYNMREIARTDAYEWSPAVLDSMNKLLHYHPTRWERCSAATAADFSAVAFHFGRILADSLGCHVGLMLNAVGGSGIEAWIDRTTVEREYPQILYDWKQNDHIQPWVRGRGQLNTKQAAHNLQRHPYEPCYLFESGIRPIADYDVRGVIWYQGESNAHNIELHERLFPMLCHSWRAAFRNPELPIHFVQLSSIGPRTSWPLFRDSQRRLAASVPHTWMAVSSDVGDSLDVHPRRKQPVGERLALQALKNTYGLRYILSSGPEFAGAARQGDCLVLTFRHAEGLRPAAGNRWVGFEVAGADGIYHTAEVRMQGNTLVVWSQEVKSPEAVRYGWQPFTRANLVNAAGLPCSTFRQEAIGRAGH